MQSTSSSHSHILLVFLKEPVEGKVKTRLAKSIGSTQATQYYKAMVATLIDEITPPTSYHIRFCYAPNWAARKIEEWITPLMGATPSLHYDYVAQASGNLGDRLLHATEQAFSEGFTRVTLIGTDTPSLNRQIISSINHETHITIGPTYDGGYYLLSLQALYPKLFQQIPWSSTTTYQVTLQIAQQEGLSYTELSPLYDIDEIQDLKNVLSIPQLGKKLATHYDSL